MVVPLCETSKVPVGGSNVFLNSIALPKNIYNSSPWASRSGFQPFFFLSVTHSEKCILLCIAVCILHKHMYNTHLTEHHLVLTTWDALTCSIHFKLFYSNLKISSLWPAKMVSHGLTNLQFEKHWPGGKSRRAQESTGLCSFLYIIWWTTLLRPENTHIPKEK